MVRILNILRRLRDNPIAQEALGMDAEDVATVVRTVGSERMERPMAAPAPTAPPVKVTIPKTLKVGKTLVATDDF